MSIKLNWISSLGSMLGLTGTPHALWASHSMDCTVSPSLFLVSASPPPPQYTLSYLTLRIKNASYICFYHPKNSGKSYIPLLFLLLHLLLTQPTPQFFLICIFTYTPPPPPKLTHVHFAAESSQHILSLMLAVPSAHNFLFTPLGLWDNCLS